MGISFQVPPHGEARIFNVNFAAMRKEIAIRNIVSLEMAQNVAVRADTVGANVPGDAPAVLALEYTGIPVDDPRANVQVAETLAQAAGDTGNIWTDKPSVVTLWGDKTPVTTNWTDK